MIHLLPRVGEVSGKETNPLAKVEAEVEAKAKHQGNQQEVEQEVAPKRGIKMNKKGQLLTKYLLPLHSLQIIEVLWTE